MTARIVVEGGYVPTVDSADIAVLGLGATPPLARVHVGGRAIVEESRLVTAEEKVLAEEVVAASRELTERL